MSLKIDTRSLSALPQGSRILPKTQKLIINSVSQHQELTRLNRYNVPSNFEEFLPLCTIRSGNKLVDFLPYEYQLEIGKLIDRHRKVMIFKVRQTGISELIGTKLFHKSLLNPAYAGAVISMGQTESSKLSKRIQLLPSKIKDFRWETQSATELKAYGCGNLYFRPSTENAARSFESIGTLFFDEAAFVPGFSELYANAGATQQMVGDEAERVVASTMSPDGKLSHFWNMFDSDNPLDAEEVVNRVRSGKEEPFTYWIDDAGWAKAIVHWKAHPIYRLNPNYLEDTKRKEKITENQLQREYNLGIPLGGGSLFNSEAVDRAASSYWDRPELGRLYMVAVDPNFGGSDNFVALCLDITSPPYRVVAEYAEADKSTEYSQERTIALMDGYKPVITAIEANGGGKVIAEIIGRKRPHARIELTNTTGVSKKQNTDRVALAIEQDELVYPPDWQGIGEMKRFSVTKREAITGYDDRVMALACGFAWIDEAVASKPRARSQPQTAGRINNPFG